MLSRRSRFEICVDILTQINNGVILPTPLMYSVHLPYKPLQQMLESLTSQGLVNEHSLEDSSKRSKRFYSITDKGERVLKNFYKAKKLMDIETLVLSPSE